MIVTAAKLAGISPALLWSICMVETGLVNTDNLDDGGSPSYGVCQIKESTAQMFNRDINPEALQIPEINLYYAGRYLRWQMKRYKDLECVIAGYNAGTCYRNKWGRVANNGYVKKVYEYLCSDRARELDGTHGYCPPKVFSHQWIGLPGGDTDHTGAYASVGVLLD